ncbi:hypothetical protein [Billgrantia zhangzhouensis]|uniref:hypothetical protein n=1 Tax=Billgrantia zhangzhouensis TaxID=2733481 RepID=UPI001F43BF86|nr:hypothetical protein [Halomonas zhangzhouensis]
MTGTPAHERLEQLETLSTRWLVAMDELFESHISLPVAVAEYRQRWLSLENPDAPLPTLRRARREHHQHWHILAERCS